VIRIQLDDATRSELQALRRTALAPAARDRLEMVLLSEAGWSPPRIAAHLRRYPQAVRNALHDFRRRPTAALYPDRPGPDPDHARRQRVVALLRDLLGQDRTWTSAQLADALRPHGVALGGRQVRRYLALLKAGYRRTAQTVGHRQDPAKVGPAATVLSGAKKKRRRAG